ncbi:MAG: lipopolysaccharide heptosyltransferase I [Desulfuromonadales bacterium]
MRVLIIKTSALGDVVHALPVIDYLHQVSPGIEIDWVVEEHFLPVLEHNPSLARIHAVSTRKWRKAPLAPATRADMKALRAALRTRSYDIVFDIQGNLKSGLIAWLCGAGERIGFSAEAVQEKLNLLFTTRKIPFLATDRNVTDRYLRVVSTPFGKDFSHMNLTGAIFSADGDELAAELYMAKLPPGFVLLFQVGTTWRTKLWYPEGWIELARRITARYPDTTILVNWGSPDEQTLGEQIMREVGDSVQLLPWLRINELIPVIRRVDLLIGGDTGPLYLAAAVGTATVSYYRATCAATYAPRGERHIAVRSLMQCTPCQQTTCELDSECRKSITVDALFDAVIRLLD